MEAALPKSVRRMVNHSPVVMVFLAAPPVGVAVLDVTGTLDRRVDFVADRLEVLTVVFVPTNAVGTMETAVPGALGEVV